MQLLCHQSFNSLRAGVRPSRALTMEPVNTRAFSIALSLHSSFRPSNPPSGKLAIATDCKYHFEILVDFQRPNFRFQRRLGEL